jgi:hypothetical protein
MTDEQGPTLDPVLELPDPHGRGVLRGKPLSPSESTSDWVLRTTWTLVRSDDGTEQPLPAGTAFTLLFQALQQR